MAAEFRRDGDVSLTKATGKLTVGRTDIAPNAQL